MPRGKYDRTISARAFDLARHLLPLATYTSVAQVVSARTLEEQVSRLLGSKYQELRLIGSELKEACKVTPSSWDTVMPPVAPTLVKYADASDYPESFMIRAASLLRRRGWLVPTVSKAPDVHLTGTLPTRIDLLATMLYRAAEGIDFGGLAYLIADKISMNQAEDELLGPTAGDRGVHEYMLREYRVGYSFNFDFLVDLGVYRDLHRHRRCVQIAQELTARLGTHDVERVFELCLTADGAQIAKASGALELYQQALDDVMPRIRKFEDRRPDVAPYLLPLAARRRALFKMDFAEAAYIIEYRTPHDRHPVYRDVVWSMYQQLLGKESWAKSTLRITEPRQLTAEQLLKR